jgi:vancomycin permeability regulator SanA
MNTQIRPVAASMVDGVLSQNSILERNHDSDFFLVLGHALNTDGTPKRELVGRLEMALYASENHPSAKLVVSGGGQVVKFKEAKVMKQWLEEKGVSGDRILMELNSRDTVENITMSTTLLTQQKARSVCLITGTQHIERALYLLLSHLELTNKKMDVSHLVSTTPDTDRTSKGNFRRERFLLFKDLGRIFGIWQNRDWKQLP